MLPQLLLLLAALLWAGPASATELVRVRVSQFTGAEPATLSSASHPALFVLDPSIASAELTADNPAAPVKEDDGPGNWFPGMTPLRPGVLVPGTIELTITPVAAPVVFGRLHFRTAARFPGNPSSFVLSWSKDAFASPLELIDMTVASTRTIRLEAPASDEATTFRWTAGSDFGDFGGGQSGFGGVDIVVTTPLCQDPPAECAAPPFASLSLHGNADPARSKLAWSWSGGNFALAQLGGPDAAPLFAFCLYDESGLVMESPFGPDLCGKKSCWKEQSQGFSYKSKGGGSSGITALKVKATSNGVSGSLKGAGANLELPLPLAATTGVKAQLVRSDLESCWESDFAPPAETDEALEFEDSLP